MTKNVRNFVLLYILCITPGILLLYSLDNFNNSSELTCDIWIEETKKFVSFFIFLSFFGSITILHIFFDNYCMVIPSYVSYILLRLMFMAWQIWSYVWMFNLQNYVIKDCINDSSILYYFLMIVIRCNSFFVSLVIFIINCCVWHDGILYRDTHQYNQNDERKNHYVEVVDQKI